MTVSSDVHNILGFKIPATMLMALYDARASTIVFCLSRVEEISPMMVYVEGPIVQL